MKTSAATEGSPVFTGLSAFPLTPFRDGAFDELAFARLIERLVKAEVDSITTLGSTGSYMYLDRDERQRVIRAAVREAHGIPVMAGIGAIRTAHVHAFADDAQEAGASAVLLAPVTYQKLSDDEVFGLYEDITARLSVPLVVYDNPGTTHVTFTDELYRRIAALPRIASIKIPGVPADPRRAETRVQAIRRSIPDSVTIGVSGDSAAATGLNAGCTAWYSVIGGTLPAQALAISTAAATGDKSRAVAESARLEPLWALFAEHGSLRVIAAVAERLGLVSQDSLPRPVMGLGQSDRAAVSEVVAALGLREVPE